MTEHIVVEDYEHHKKRIHEKEETVYGALNKFIGFCFLIFLFKLFGASWLVSILGPVIIVLLIVFYKKSKKNKRR